ncbi:MAG: efflux RND transporter periplasmic adaptor subunit [Deltaproteobacteria bacterium]|nr:efflux RND transporter periplasmic adaptor subunit [Deltaproteobacteria bacterium]
MTRAIATLSVVLAWTACAPSKKAPPTASELPTAKVQTVIASAERSAASERIAGTVRARLRATLEAKVAGRIAKMAVKPGDQVKRGQFIASLDVAEVNAKLKRAEVVLAQARIDRDRFTKLLESQAVTKSEADQAQMRFAVAQAQTAEARSMLAYATLRAPFGGVITHKLADVGDLATPGRPIAEIEDPQALRLEINAPGALLGFIKVGAEVPVQIAESQIKGTIAEVAPVADPNTRTFLVKIDLPTAEGLRSGQFGRADISTGRKTVLRLPKGAVIRRGQMELAFVVAKDGTASLRIVKTGKHQGDRVELVAGIDAGEQVVISNVAQLIEGQKLEVIK